MKSTVEAENIKSVSISVQRIMILEQLGKFRKCDQLNIENGVAVFRLGGRIFWSRCCYTLGLTSRDDVFSAEIIDPTLKFGVIMRKLQMLMNMEIQ